MKIETINLGIAVNFKWPIFRFGNSPCIQLLMSKLIIVLTDRKVCAYYKRFQQPTYWTTHREAAEYNQQHVFYTNYKRFCETRMRFCKK